MSAPIRAQHRPPPIHHNRDTTQGDVFSPCRIPTKSSSIERSASGRAQHISKLARGLSRSERALDDEAEPRECSVKQANIPLPVARRRAAVSREDVVSPHPASAEQCPRRPSRSTSFQPPSTIRTPSLFSGSSAQTLNSPQSRGLRRKPSTIDSYKAQVRAHGSGPEVNRTAIRNHDEAYNEAFEDSVFGIALPPTGKDESRDACLNSSAPKSTLPYLDTKSMYIMRDFTPPVPGLSHSATPSSRYTDSPYSHVPTPNSASSYTHGASSSGAVDAKYATNSPPRPRPAPSVTSTNQNSRSALPRAHQSSSFQSSLGSAGRTQNIKSETSVQGAPSVAVPLNNKAASYKNLWAKPQDSSLPTWSTRPDVQVPPELAHLNVDAPMNYDSTASQPRRPSRDRTPSLGMDKSAPVVHSDLPRLFTAYHKRTPSQDTTGSATSQSFRSRFGFSPRSTSKQGSPRIDSAISPSALSIRPARMVTPEPLTSDRPRLLRKDSPAITKPPSPVVPSKSPRFSFLSRKVKSNTETSAEKPKREPRKGPVAGTGHEKYARFGFRGRSGSAASTQAFGRSPSTDSNISGATKSSAGRKGSTSSEDASNMDEFLLERLNPVVLRGNREAFGTQTTIWAGKDEESSSSPSVETLPRPQLLPSAMTVDYDTSPERSVAASMNGGNDFPEERSDQFAESPVLVEHVTQSPSQESYDSGKSIEAHSSNVNIPEESRDGKEGLWLRPLRKERPTPKLKHKRNFLQRAQSSQLTEPPMSSDGNSPAGVDVPAKLYQDAIHLGILDAIEPVKLAEVERVVQDHDMATTRPLHQGRRHSRLVSSGSGRSSFWPSPAQKPFRESDASDARRLSPSVMANQILTESPELLQARAAIAQQPRQVVRMVAAPRSAVQLVDHSQHQHEATPFIATPELAHKDIAIPETPRDFDSARHPRLSPIGRIPMVVSKRDRDRRLPDNSFSRPFASTQPRPTVRPPGSLYNQIRDLASPEPASQPVSSTSERSDTASAANQSSVNVDQPSASTNRSSLDFYAGNDFIVFAPRKNSDFTYSSSSSSSNWRSLMPADASEDDIWNEYNDLMDDVIHDKPPISAGSSLGAPFQYTSFLQDEHSPAMPAPLNVGRSVSQPTMPTTQDTLLTPAPMASDTLQPPVSPMAPEEHAAVAFAASQQDDRYTSRPVSPLTPDTLARFVGTYGDRSTTSSVVQNRLSIPQSRIGLLTPSGSLSSRYSRNSRRSRTGSLPEPHTRNSQISVAASVRLARDAHLLDIPGHNSNKRSTGSSDLRFGALMTSKWLSFGSILFSPAHNEVRLTDEARILVVDGLGNDWSHYVAASYPNAVVYNLNIASASHSESSGWPPLPNYQNFNHASVSAPFPFPKGFFTAIVFRFPVAATEQKYQDCILECKRVLRPGGHLEVVALDIDMMNMGTRGRRALRGLKTRMQQTDRNVSLGNLSDTLVRMIGRRGFEDVQRCVVGVPAAGRIPRSDDVFRSSSCSSTSTSGRPRTSNSSATDQQESDINFAAMLQKNRQSQIVEPGRANDEGITKMVARVGRWWYSACYEQPLLEHDKSVWQEPGLLRECEKQGTSFRLLICCAQKPLQPRRRTKSV